MQSLPLRSPGVLLASVLDTAIAYDLVAETTHRLNPSAAALLEACCGDVDRDGLVRRWATDSGVDIDVVDGAVTDALLEFTSLGLVGRTTTFEVPEPPTGCGQTADPTYRLGASHPVIDHRIGFRSPQPDLLDEIDDYLGTGLADVDANLVFDIHRTPDGHVHMQTDETWEFATIDRCLGQLVSVLNDYAGFTYSCAVIHAAAVSSPDGEIVLLPGPSGQGKSTLAAAFLQRGWGYLGDETIGVRPGTRDAVGYPKRLALDARSREAIGLDPTPPGGRSGFVSAKPDMDPTELRQGVAYLSGDVGTISRVLFPRFVEGTGVELDDIPPDDAVIELLASTRNLGRAGQVALDGVCDLAASVPVQRLSYSDARSAVAHLT